MRSDRYRPDSPPYLLYGILGASLVLNLFMAIDRDPPAPESGDVALSADVDDFEVGPSVDGEAAVSATPAATTAGVEVVAMDAAPGGGSVGGYSSVRGVVDHSLARTFRAEVGDENADAVAAVYSRQFMWDLDLRRDLRKGDVVTAAYRVLDNGDVDMPVAWFESSKLGRTMKAYRYQAPGDSYASYWYADGTEVPLRLVAGPLEDYEQITSLLKDRPTHKGMDFKADVGTPVVSPKAGTVTRVNWNWSANGNCVEVRFPDGTLAKFLHLDKVKVQAGQHVSSGQVLADSGNTGRSTAPHLHYQLDKGSKVVDPLDFHDTIRRKLPASAMKDFNREVARLDALLPETVASR